MAHYPADTFQEATEIAIEASNQLHKILNGDSTTEITVEDGSKIPSVRKAQLDSMYFKAPVAWLVGSYSVDYLQLYKFEETNGTFSWWFAKNATTTNPILMASTPNPDSNWTLYSTDYTGLRQIYKRLAAEAGFNLVDGSFEEGAVISGWPDVVWSQTDGKYYQWYLDEAKTIAAGSTPSTAGTVADGTNPASGGFVDKSGGLLRHELATSNGATKVGTSDGGSVQDFIDDIGQTHTRTFANVDAMLAFNGLVVGQRYSTGGTTWEYLGGGNTIDKFKALNAVNVLDFGAVGDGLSDDTQAVLGAVSLGGTVLLDGRLRITGTIKVPSQTRLVGASGGALIRDGSFFLLDARGKSNISVESVNFEMVNERSVLVYFAGCTDIKVKYCTVSAQNDGTYPYSEGIALRECNRVWVDSNHFNGTSGHCLVVGTNTTSPVGDCNDVWITNNIFENFGNTSVLGGSLALDVSGGYAGSKLYPVRRCIVSGNTFRNGYDAGVKLQLVEDCIFRDNNVYGMDYYGLILNGLSKPSSICVDNNNIHNNHINMWITSYTLLDSEQTVQLTNNIIADPISSLHINCPNMGGEFLWRGNKFEGRSGATIIKFDDAATVYSDRGTHVWENNYIEASNIFMSGIPRNTILIDNYINVGTYGVFASASGATVKRGTFRASGNKIKGFSQTGLYTLTAGFKELTVSDNIFSDTQAGARFGIYMLSNAGVVWECDYLNIRDNSIITSVADIGIYIEENDRSIGYGLVNGNIIKKTGGSSEIRVPAEVILDNNFTIPL